ncbi:MAG: hypothetical protein ABIJ34_02370 [archaeon]
MNRFSVSVTIFFIVAVSIMYFAFSENETMLSLPADIEFKTAVSDGELKLFAHANNNEIAMLKSKGNPLPDVGTIVVGSSEASRMDLAPGTKIKVFGHEMEIEGVLAKTGSILDSTYLLDSHDFINLNAEDKIIVYRDMESVTYFYNYDPQDSINLILSEGSMEDYWILNKGNEKYLPALVGSDVKDNNLKLGDVSKYHGENIIVKGFLTRTGTPLDYIIIIGGKK